MLQSLWNYLRRMACQAILDGAADAVEQLEAGQEEPVKPELPAAIRDRLSLPAPSSNGRPREKAAK